MLPAIPQNHLLSSCFQKQHRTPIQKPNSSTFSLLTYTLQPSVVHLLWPQNLSLPVQPHCLGQEAAISQTGHCVQAVLLTSPSPAVRLVIVTINLIISLCFNSIYRIKTKALKMTH